jgi:hypothetical protein
MVVGFRWHPSCSLYKYISDHSALEGDAAHGRSFHGARFLFGIVPGAGVRAPAHGARIVEQAADPFRAAAAPVVDVSFRTRRVVTGVDREHSCLLTLAFDGTARAEVRWRYDFYVVPANTTVL